MTTQELIETIRNNLKIIAFPDRHDHDELVKAMNICLDNLDAIEADFELQNKAYRLMALAVADSMPITGMDGLSGYDIGYHFLKEANNDTSKESSVEKNRQHTK